MPLRALLLLSASLLLAATPARAQPAGHEISLGTGTLQYLVLFQPSVSFKGLELTYHRRVQREGAWSALRLGGGLRTAMPTASAAFPLEGFLQAQLTARVGPWEAAVGPEVGFSGFTRLRHRFPFLGEVYEDMQDSLVSPLYVSIGAAPLRFRVTPHLLLSALEVNVGTLAPPFGNAARIHLGLLRVGVEL